MIAEAIILGSGTSNGCPSLGFEYPESFLANPKNWRTRPSLLLRGPTGNLLVDCAPEMRLQLLRERILDVEAVLITHTHADHIMGMDDLRCFELRSGRNMPIYAQDRDHAVLKRVFEYAFREFPAGVHVPRFELHEVPRTLRVGGMEIMTFTVRHGPTPVVGLRVGGFAYLTDVNHIPDDVWPLLEGLETLVLDAVRREPHPNHFHFSRAIEVAEQIGAKQTYFTHLSHDFDHDAVEAYELPVQIRLAYDGLRIVV